MEYPIRCTGNDTETGPMEAIVENDSAPYARGDAANQTGPLYFRTPTRRSHLIPIDSGMTYGQMRMAVLGCDVTVASAILPGMMAGMYDEASRTILIDRRLTYRQKRCTLVHELMHWRHGDGECSWGQGKAERRARRETALTLVSPIEYALAEQLYDGKPEPIAQELNVTRQVIEDYRMMLHESMPIPCK